MNASIRAERAAQHLARLSRDGMSATHIARRTGISPQALTDIAEHRIARISAEAEVRILAVQPQRLSPADLVSARGAQRRIQALHVVGHSTTSIAAHMGWRPSYVEQVLSARTLSRRRQQLIASAYDQLWERTPEDPDDAAAARQLAYEHGWSSPLAWDDIDADVIPPETPPGPESVDDIAVELAIDGHSVLLTRPEQIELVRRLTISRVSLKEIAERLDVSESTVQRMRRFAGVTGLNWSMA